MWAHWSYLDEFCFGGADVVGLTVLHEYAGSTPAYDALDRQYSTGTTNRIELRKLKGDNAQCRTAKRSTPADRSST